MNTYDGVTPRGMRDQLIGDGFVLPEAHSDPAAAATYLRDAMWSAIGETAVAARRIMEWLQVAARKLAEAGHALQWETPTGSTIRQAYHPWTLVRPLTAFGQITVASSVDKGSLRAAKCAAGAAPNFVHSFDAAHLALTVNAGRAEGITHWCMVHDSYGTHAARMDTMGRVLRREFVNMYANDWLMRTWEGIGRYAPGVEVPKPPERGSFDLRQVADSPWFFA